MKKKLISLMLAGAMAFSMTACGLGGNDASTDDSSTDAPADDATDEPADDAADEPADEPADDASADNSDAAAANDPAVTLVMAEVNPLDTIVGQMDSKFKEEV